MSASKPKKEVTMTKARLISLMVLLCLLAFYLQATGGGPGSWFDGA
jgi:hypothetical protein